MTAGPKGPGGMKRVPAPTRAEAVEGVARELRARGEIESPRVEAERLVAHVAGVERSDLALGGGEELSPGEARRLARVVGRRLSGEPLQHIEGTVQFRELVLLADGRALVPRPETEQLVERVRAWAERRQRERDAAGEDGGEGGGSVRRAGGRGEREPLLERVLDVGTGSGAIALSLVHEGIARRAVGVDVSAEALLQAAANRGAAELGEEEVEFRLAERPVWTAVRRDERFDAVVSNPPYVSEGEWVELPEEIREHEPREALVAGPGGLEVIREVAEGASAYLERGGALFLEIGAGQALEVRELLEGDSAWAEVEVEADLAGRERFVRAEKGR